MGRPRLSIRTLIVAVAVVGFDVAAMTRAVHLGRLAHSVASYALGFGLVLLVLNLDVLALLGWYASRPEKAKGGRLRATPPPLVVVGVYTAALAVAILSVLFLTSGRF